MMRVARAAHWMLRGVILLGDYGLINLTACSLTAVLPRRPDLRSLENTNSKSCLPVG